MFISPSDRAGRKIPNIGLSFIDEKLLLSDATSVSFTQIPSIYRHLLIIAYARSTESAASPQMFMQFNGDTGSNYDYQVAVGLGAITAAAAGFAQTRMRLNEIPGATSSSASQAGVVRITIPHYAGATFNKSYESSGGCIFGTSGSNALSGIASGQWRNTTPINRVDLIPNANSFKAGALFSMYGYY